MGLLGDESLEIDLLLEAIYRKYHYDFRSYSRASIKRRIFRRMRMDNIPNLGELLHRVVHDKAVFESLLLDLSINVTEMFRDPSFFEAVRLRVLPVLEEQAFIRVWHAGCATGEEVYSMAILLREAGLYSRCRIYATDFNEMVISQAKLGVYPVERMREYTRNYQAAGGARSFGDYYTAQGDSAILDGSLRENIVFADHNLATDSVFSEMDLILCRNVLIYFSRELQDRALCLFRDALREDGFLCIGAKETPRHASCSGDFADFDRDHRIYTRLKT